MPVESASFISQLNPANPLTTDPIAQADDHIRLLKSTLQSQFTNLGAVAVTATAAQINSSGTAFATDGVMSVVKKADDTIGGEVNLQPVTGSGRVFIQNNGHATFPGLLQVAIYDAANTTAAIPMTLDRSGNMALTGTLAALTVTQAGQPIVPAGVIVMWSGSVASIPSGWQLCNGNFGAPDLRDRFVIGAGGSLAPNAILTFGSGSAQVSYALCYIMKL